jgi:hypothetical protein
VGTRDGLDDVEKRKFLTLPGPELRPLGRPARNHRPYRLRYPGVTQDENQSNSEMERKMRNAKTNSMLGYLLFSSLQCFLESVKE